jgi:hypothetical protein
MEKAPPVPRPGLSTSIINVYISFARFVLSDLLVTCHSVFLCAVPGREAESAAAIRAAQVQILLSFN